MRGNKIKTNLDDLSVHLCRFNVQYVRVEADNPTLTFTFKVVIARSTHITSETSSLAQIPVEDPISQSNYTQIVTTNVSLDWTVDFEKRCIHGSVAHQLVPAIALGSDYRDCERVYPAGDLFL